MQRSVPVDEKDPAVVATRARFPLVPGTSSPFNRAPANLVEIDAADLASTLWGSYTPDLTEFKQFPLASAGGRVVGAHLHYFWDGTGVGFYRDDKRIAWFRFGCTDPRHSIHRCPACGHAATFDSSG